MPEPIAVIEFPGVADAALLPAPVPEARPYEDGLASGVLRLQACGGCGRLRFPVAPVCPYCNSEETAWQSVSGRGRVHTWARYHRAFVPAFERLVPYVVVLVALDGGPLLPGRLASDAEPAAGMTVRMVVERWPGGRCVPAFVPAEPAR